MLRRNGHEDFGGSEHIARRFEHSWFDDRDLMLPVDPGHRPTFGAWPGPRSSGRKLRLFRSFDPEAVAAGELGMDDPWYGTEAAYDQTYAEIKAAADGVVEHVRAELALRLGADRELQDG